MPADKLVLHVYYKIQMGGAENITLALIKNDTFFLHHVLVFGAETDYQRYCSDKYGIKFTNLNWSKRGLLRLRNWRSLIKAVKEVGPDIIHTNMYDASMYGRLVALMLGIPAISLVANTYKYKKYKRGIVNYFLGFFTKKIIAVSEDVKKDILKFDRVDSSKVVTVPSFTILDYKIDLTRHIRSDLGINESDYVGLFIARLVEQKGISYLIEAVRICVSEFGLNNFKMVIIGDGPLRERLLEVIRAHQLENHIFLVGEIRDLNPYLTEADIYVDSSLWSGLSLAVIKAMEASLPVIITDTGGAREITDNGKYGYLCRSASASALAEKIKLCVQSRIQKNHQSAEFIQANFSDKVLSENIVNIYKNIIWDSHHEA